MDKVFCVNCKSYKYCDYGSEWYCSYIKKEVNEYNEQERVLVRGTLSNNISGECSYYEYQSKFLKLLRCSSIYLIIIFVFVIFLICIM